MSVFVALSESRDPTQCARELREKVADAQLTFVVFFTSTAIEPGALGSALRAQFGSVPSLGCTTAGEFGQGRVLEGSVVLMGFDAETISGASVAEIKGRPSREAVSDALGELSSFAGAPIADLSPERYVGLVLHDGLGAQEERVMSELSQRTNVPFVGGSAGDDSKFSQTHVFVDFEARPAGSALALLRPAKPYGVVKSQSFRTLGVELVATEVLPGQRVVKTFNGRPAAEEYAKHLGCSVEELPKLLPDHPLGLMVGDDEPWVRSAWQIGEDGRMTFYCQILAGMHLQLLEREEIVDKTRRDLAQGVSALSQCSAVLNFTCLQRIWQLAAEGRVAEYGAVFRDIPTIGFATYGESYIGHMNHTSTMVLLD